MRRFDRYWEVLLAQLVLFRFAYPSDRDNIPDPVLTELLSRAVDTLRQGNEEERVCRGNLLSSVNYRLDIEAWGYLDGRVWDEQKRGERGTGSELENQGGGDG
jgi:hypothetical protein